MHPDYFRNVLAPAAHHLSNSAALAQWHTTTVVRAFAFLLGVLALLAIIRLLVTGRRRPTR